MSKSHSILVGVSGGIAAYKVAELVSRLTQANHLIQVVMTTAAEKLVGAPTFRALSRQPVLTDLFAESDQPVTHIEKLKNIELFVLAPATANIIGKIANGIADDLLTTMVMAYPGPKLIVPAMNTDMWQNPIVQENLHKLIKLGYLVIAPESGYLACGTAGAGRYPDNQAILEKINEILEKKSPKPLQGKKVIITAGGTTEPLDPVRVITNRSSGKMGQALKTAAESAGAQVKFIQAAGSTAELKNKIAAEFATADVLIMAAAVADYRPKNIAAKKIKSDAKNITLELEKNEDLLAFFGRQKQKQYLVGFALESENLEQNAQKKLTQKNLDLIVANEVSALGADNSSIKIIARSQEPEEYQNMDKTILAEKIIARICRDLSK